MADATPDIRDAQRIARLTPLADVLARVAALVRPVAPREVAVAQALGRALATDVVAAACPGAAMALRDGWAVSSDLTADASAYAPAPLRSAARIEVGEPLPAGADAVAELDSVTLRDGAAQAVAATAAGEGVLPVGGDIAQSATLLRSGQRLGRVQAAVLVAAGVSNVTVREPNVRVTRARVGRDPIIDAVVDFIAHAVDAQGCVAWIDQDSAVPQLEDALQDTDVDAVIVVGGTGVGRNDASVATLARLGRVETHGIALSPGETAALGSVGSRPVLLVPGRLDAAAAVWLMLGRGILQRLAGRIDEARSAPARLTRKVASRLGVAELIPLLIHDGMAEPLAAGYLSLDALARSNGWMLVPADSEGCPAGTDVVVGPWP